MMGEIKPTVRARCICCERPIEPACKTDSEEEYIEIARARIENIQDGLFNNNSDKEDA